MGLDNTAAQTLNRAKLTNAQRYWRRFIVFAFVFMAGLAVVSAPWAIVREQPETWSFGFAGTWLAIVGTAIYFAARLGRTAFVVLITISIVALRLAMLWMTHGSLPTTVDPGAYQALAVSVASGEGLKLDLIPAYGSVQAVFPPLYPLILAPFVALLGNNASAPVLLNFILDMLTAYGIYRLVMTLSGQREDDRNALLAAFLYLVWPSVLIGSIWPQKESLVCLLLVTFVRLAIQLRDCGPRTTTAAFMGGNAALIALTQPSLSLIPAAFFLASICKLEAKKMARLGAAFGLAGVAVMLPWWLRNYFIFHQFVPLTSGNGLSLRMLTQGAWPLPADVMSRSELERTHYATSQALDQIFGDPARFVVQQVKNFVINLTVDVPVTAPFDYLATPLAFDKRAFSLTLQIAPALLWVSATSALFLAKGDRNARFLATFIVLSLLMLATANSMLEFGPRHRAFLMPLIWTLVAVVITKKRTGTRRLTNV